jgi:amino acid transporter
VVIILGIYLCSPDLATSDFVFTEYLNRTGFESPLYVSCLGLLTSLYAFAGYEGAAALAEETKNPHEAAPRGVFYTVVVSFIVGLITMVSILYGT